MAVITLERKMLRGIPDIRRYFHRSETPIYFVSATNFNLLGIDEWARNFRYINYIDCFDGAHPHVFVPKETPHRTFNSMEEINNYLLEHKEVRDYIQRLDRGGKAVFLFFDEQTEQLCEELGLELCFPPAHLRREIDDKIGATRIAERAGVKCVPNVLARVDGYDTLRRLSRDLGDELVIQTSFGDSGHTTFFVRDEADFNEHADEITADGEVKVMKKVRCRQAALEACVTRVGTIVGPLMTELVGFPELTPYRGGWCGNEVFADAFTREIREQARADAFAFGEELKRMGYRGYFELDFLLDLDTGELYLGEVNPRITGASSMTNLAAFAHADAPLFLFHLLEFSGIDFELDVVELNARWADPDNIDTWSQLVLKHTGETVEHVAAAPRSGIWRLSDDGAAEFVRVQTHRRTVESESQGFFLRIANTGDYFYEGADLGILVTPGRLMDDEGRLSNRAQAWIKGIRAHYQSTPLTTAQAEAAPAVHAPAFKIL
ncbi:MAG: biotin carboxylase [Planctomycetota bacterium]|jgi:D-alanine-D-alanine ligase-like ATP-grasp enzyme